MIIITTIQKQNKMKIIIIRKKTKFDYFSFKYNDKRQAPLLAKRRTWKEHRGLGRVRRACEWLNFGTSYSLERFAWGTRSARASPSRNLRLLLNRSGKAFNTKGQRWRWRPYRFRQWTSANGPAAEILAQCPWPTNVRTTRSSMQCQSSAWRLCTL